MKDELDDETLFQLTNLHNDYQRKLRIVLNENEELENEEILFETRVISLH